ncbi:MAG: FKBP-type peptidyl-prolyl cis-trans isomerase [Legionellales bacterium]
MKKLLQLITVASLTLSLAACGGGGSSSSSSGDPSASCSAGSSASSGSSSVTALSISDSIIGSGPAVVAGNTLVVNYTGWLYQSGATNNEGAQFGTTAGGQPFQFQIGTNPSQVIAGWDQGLLGMQAGGVRTLTIPSALAYGSCAPVGSNIPPGSALVFTVSLVSVAP